MMNIALQAWYDAWLEEYRKGTDLYYANPANPSLAQVHFVRDELAPLLWADTLYDDIPSEPAPRKDARETAWVIGEHRSKSVRLPVYRMERKDLGIQFVMRHNFYDWKLSVKSDTPIDSSLFPFLFHTTPPVAPEYTGNELLPVYFEGFPKELVYGYHSENPCQWSAQLGQHGLYMVFFETMRQLGVVPRKVWHTPESFRAKLDADAAAFKRRREREGW